MRFNKIAKSIVASTLGLAVLLFGVASQAQEIVPDIYTDPGLYPNRDYVNSHLNEYIDPFTGTLQYHQVDFYVPGNGGFDLKVIRSYNSALVDPVLTN